MCQVDKVNFIQTLTNIFQKSITPTHREIYKTSQIKYSAIYYTPVTINDVL